MPEIKIKDLIANYDNDQKQFNKAERLLDIGYTKEEDEVSLAINIGPDDHCVIVVVDRIELLKVISDALINPLE